MRKQGVGYPTITKTLNGEGILPPKIYYLKKAGKDSSHIRNRNWINITVTMILKKESYIGTAEQFVTTVISHRNKRPVEDRVRVENAFPAIIDREMWTAVQEVNRLATEKCSHRSKPQKPCIPACSSVRIAALVWIDCRFACEDKMSIRSQKTSLLHLRNSRTAPRTSLVSVFVHVDYHKDTHVLKFTAPVAF